MRVLALLADIPDPPVSGSKVRNFHLWKELVRAGVEVRVLGTHFNPALGPVARGADGEYFLPDRRELRAKLSDLALRSYHEQFKSTALLERARGLVRDWKPDVVHGEELRMGRYLLDLGPGAYQRTITLHNVETDLIRRTGSFPYRLGRELFNPIHRVSLARFERRVIDAADLAFAYSEPDLARYLELFPGARMQASRNGVAARAIEPAPEPDSPRVLIVGSLSYEPNVQGLIWFLEQVLPLLPASIAITVAGSNATPAVRARLARAAKRIEFVDTPPDLSALYRASTVCAVPVFEGGGTRTKILEALAHRRLVVSTRVGVEGLALDDGFSLAETPREFADLLLRYSSASEEKSRMTLAGREAVLRGYDWSVAAIELKQAWSKLIGA